MSVVLYQYKKHSMNDGSLVGGVSGARKDLQTAVAYRYICTWMC